ncbi:MAG: hypothetical protein HY902_15570 [Deltaproteobacteria bacterium]|nr:hypothetical protein [Deltaproteobacteria bacterium]
MRFSHAIATLCCSAALCSAVPGHAADRGHLNRCADATRELRGATSQVYKDRDVEPGEAQGAIAHINQHTERYNRAQKMLDSAGPWDPKDPDLAECVGLLQRAREYIEATQKKIKAAQEAATQQAPVMAAAKGEPKRRAFFLLAAVHAEPSARAFDNLKPAEAKALVESLAPVDAACQQAMPQATQTAPTLPARSPGGSEWRVGQVVLPASLADRAAWWCWISSHRTQLATRALGNVHVVAEGYGNHHIAFAEIFKAGEGWSGSADPWVFEVARDSKPFFAGLNKAVGGWYTAFGIPLPSEPFPGLAEQVGKVREAIVAAAARNTIEPGKNRDKALEGAAKSALAKIYPKVSVPAAWMDEAGWTVEQNSLGVPLRRFRSGQLVYRVAGDPWCLQRTFNWVETHMGGGKYQPPGSAGILGGARAVKCP